MEDDENLLLLADVSLAPPCGRSACCSYSEEKRNERSLQEDQLQLQLQSLLSKADDLHDCLISGLGHVEKESLHAAVSSFLFSCQPYFNHLESRARSTVSQYSHVPADMCSKLLEFSQQLCDRLEQLLLTYATHGILSLNETEPDSVSHFCVGQTQLGRLKLTIFRYCKPTPYLARTNTGLYKRMRWNVERLRDQQEDGGAEEDGEEAHIDYYFLCYEDIPNPCAESDSEGAGHDGLVRMWSIGQWIQVNPDPSTEDINDWILCEVPEGDYNRLLLLGHDEPSSCSATDYLQQLLLSCCID
ncbi:UPF0575 protein C19orf67 homolog isoform X2 [Austrofundulus limnaeus]|nr:PREDICTED: UPF0575 protein C19orf67 homolog isoform X2 [Austrofundulus limnaeus]